MQNARLDESQAGNKIARRNISNLRYADNTTLTAESKEELKSILKVKEESEKVGLKLNIQKPKIMATHHFMANRWGKQWKQRQTILEGSKITAHGGCSHEIKTHLLLGRKAMTAY